MNVRDLILELIEYEPDTEIYFWSEDQLDNHWECEVKIDGANGEDLSIITSP